MVAGRLDWVTLEVLSNHGDSTILWKFLKRWLFDGFWKWSNPNRRVVRTCNKAKALGDASLVFCLSGLTIISPSANLTKIIASSKTFLCEELNTGLTFGQSFPHYWSPGVFQTGFHTKRALCRPQPASPKLWGELLCSVTWMFAKLVVIFHVQKSEAPQGGVSKEKKIQINKKNSPLGALNITGTKCADSPMFFFPHTSQSTSFIHIHVYIFPALALLNISKYSPKPAHFYHGISKNVGPWLYPFSLALLLFLFK